MSTKSIVSPAAAAFLEHYREDSKDLRRVRLDSFPFVIGRSKTAQLTVFSERISRQHAEITVDGRRFYIRDLGSRNGTYVNGEQIDRCQIVAGDIIHVGDSEFRFSLDLGGGNESMTSEGTRILREGSSAPRSMIRDRQLFRDMLDRESIACVFQPIVRLADGARIGFEALGRGACPELGADPVHLFRLAEDLGYAIELSQLFRKVATLESARHFSDTTLFLNTHPQELHEPSFIESLDRMLPSLKRGQRVVVEVHEKAVTNLDGMRRLREALRRRGILLAYDDFGAGYSRLVELVEAPPDYVKLDGSLVSGIHRSAARQELVSSIVRLAAELGILVVGEGIETRDELDALTELGCQLGQGFLLGRPAPARDSFPAPIATVAL